MSELFNARDYSILSELVFRESYPGFTPNIVEAPNGDGNYDTGKQYAHVAMKYLDKMPPTDFDRCILRDYLEAGHVKAVDVAIELGVPRDMWPSIEYSTLRVLEYPPGTETHAHTDFNLFTMMGYRNLDCFAYSDPMYFNPGQRDVFDAAQRLNNQIHFGEIIELVNPIFKATKHLVLPDVLGRVQYSVVYFAVPDHAAVLPDGRTVGAFIEERIGRSRKEIVA